MIGAIIRLGMSCGLAVAAAVVVALPAAQAQTQQQVETCTNHDGKSTPEDRITTCTMAIKSGRWSGKNLAWAYMSRGNANRNKGNYDASIADETQAIKLNAGDPDGYYNRGLAYEDKKDYDHAIADFSTAISLASNAQVAWAGGEKLAHDRMVADYYQDRANAYYKKTDYGRAIPDYSQVIRLNPGNALGLYWRGRAKQETGDTADGDADIAAAKVIDPNVGK